MLKDPDRFKALEEEIRERGIIEQFEEENGPILGRMIIDRGEIPENLRADSLQTHNEEDIYVFDCSFDFYQATLGLAFDRSSYDLVGHIGSHRKH